MKRPVLPLKKLTNLYKRLEKLLFSIVLFSIDPLGFGYSQ